MPSVPAKLAVLASLDRPKTLSQILDQADLQRETARKAVHGLADEGLVTTHKDGRDLVVTPTSTSVPERARILVDDYPRRDWRDVFHGDRPALLHVVDHVGDPEIAAEVCDKARSTVYHALKKLGASGVVVKPDGEYGINPRIQALRDLLAGMDEARATHRLRQLGPEAHLVWHLGPELLVRAPPDVDAEGFEPAALSVFARYDVPLLHPDRVFLHASHRDLTAADHILLALLVDPPSLRNRSYAALAYEQAGHPQLDRKARIYGLEDVTDDLVRYVGAREDIEGFLPWSEHQEYREQYEVDS